MTASWHRRTGYVTGPGGRARHAHGFLEGALVIARVESEPETSDAVTVTIAVDEQSRVAVVSDDRQHVVAGPTVTELAEALAETCGGQVAFDGEPVVGELAGPADDPSDPFDPEIGVEVAFAPDRAVVYTEASTDSVAALARELQMPVVTAPHGDGHLVLVADGPPLASIDWPDALTPSIIIDQGAAYPAVAAVDAHGRHSHTWDAAVEVVPSDPELAALVADLSDNILGTGALVASIRAAVPTADADAVRAAIDGPRSGPAALVQALGLPRELVAFLAHGSDTPELDGATLVQPDGFVDAFARAVTDAQIQMSESVREHAEQMRIRAEAARVRAESAFDAAETFNEEVVAPIRQSWWTPAVAAVEATLGCFALYRAGRNRRSGAPTSAGGRVLGAVGVLLLIDSAVNAGVFLASRLKRDL